MVKRPTLTDTASCSGVNSSRPSRGGRGELHSPAGAVPTQDGEASGLDPEVLHCGLMAPASELTWQAYAFSDLGRPDARTFVLFNMS